MKYYIAMWKNWSNIYGRTARKGFWTAFLVHLLVISFLAVIGAFVNFELPLKVELLSLIHSIVTMGYIYGGMIPLFSLCVRRIRDINGTPFLLLLVFIPYVGWLLLAFFFCLGSAPDNKYEVNLQKEKEKEE